MRKIELKKARKSDQIFMKDVNYLRKIVSYANLQKDDIVLEIGTGHGELTRFIAPKVKKVYTIEIDKNLIEEAKTRLKRFNNIIFIHGDALKIDFSQFSDVTKIVSNLPFSISSPITEKILLFMQEKLKEGKKIIAILTYQYEFAKRLIAKPTEREYSRITVLANCYGKVKFLKKIPKKAFYPKPKVDAAIVKIEPSLCNYPKQFFSFISILFRNKNKKIINCFPKEKRNEIRKLLNNLAEQRARHLSIKTLYEIWKKVGKCMKC